MTQHDELVYLRHILDTAREARDIVDGMARKDLDEDRLRQLALTRLLEVIGEAASRVPQETRQKMPDLPWGAMIGIRNRIIHGYDTVDYDRIWDTVKTDLPALIPLVENILSVRDGPKG